jgi:hypothetical protein
MTRILWDSTGERLYETGIDHGVLYIPDNTGAYPNGYGWNGLTGVTESPSGATPNAKYADNIKYLNLISAENFEGTIAAFTYPDAWAQCDGSATPQEGISVGQQSRKSFGLSYRTLIGNDVAGQDLGYKLHLAWGLSAQPSEKAYATVNETPDATALSWKFTSIPVPVTGFKPSATITLDSTKVDATALAALETILYGAVGVTPRLPLPDEVIALFAGTVTVVTPTAPAYNSGTHVLTIPTVTGVQYRRGDTNAIVTGGSTITLVSGQTLVVKAYPLAGYVFSPTADDDWSQAY